MSVDTHGFPWSGGQWEDTVALADYSTSRSGWQVHLKVLTPLGQFATQTRLGRHSTRYDSLSSNPPTPVLTACSAPRGRIDSPWTTAEEQLAIDWQAIFAELGSTGIVVGALAWLAQSGIEAWLSRVSASISFNGNGCRVIYWIA